MLRSGGEDAYRGRESGQMTTTCCRLGPKALNASTASSCRNSRAPWYGSEHAAGKGNSTLTPQQENDSGDAGEAELRRSAREIARASGGGGGRGAGVEKDERREEENDAAKRSILERLRDHRDAKGVPLLLGEKGDEGAESVDGGGASPMEWC
jgi:hypothetical protein